MAQNQQENEKKINPEKEEVEKIVRAKVKNISQKQLDEILDDEDIIINAKHNRFDAIKDILMGEDIGLKSDKASKVATGLCESVIFKSQEYKQGDGDQMFENLKQQVVKLEQHMRHKQMFDISVYEVESISSQSNLERQSDYSKLALFNYGYKYYEDVKCVVTDLKFRQYNVNESKADWVIHACHILPRYLNKSSRLMKDLNGEEFNDPFFIDDFRNLLFMCNKAERAYRDLRFIIEPVNPLDISQGIQIRFLDRSVKQDLGLGNIIGRTKRIVFANCPAKVTRLRPKYDVNGNFNRFGYDKEENVDNIFPYPYLRILSNHASLAYQMALERGWIEDKETEHFDHFYSLSRKQSLVNADEKNDM